MEHKNLTDEELKDAIARYKAELSELEEEIARRSWARKKDKWQTVCDALKEYLEEYGSITIETYDNTYTLNKDVHLNVTEVIHMENCAKNY